MNEWQAETIATITRNYPFDRQREIFTEKCAELIRAVQHTKTGGSTITTYNDFINALAAVSVMVDEMTAYIGEQVLEKPRTRFLDSQLIQLYRETAQTERDTT